MLLGLDLGSRRIGVVAALPALPLDAAMHTTLDVPEDPGHYDLIEIAERCTIAARNLNVSKVLIEHGAFYPGKDSSPQQIMAMHRAWTICNQLRTFLELHLDPIEAVVMARATWSHAIVPHTQGGVSDAAVNAALEALCSDRTWAELGALPTQDERDAAGLILGHMVIERRERLKEERAAERAARAAEPREPRRRIRRPVDPDAPPKPPTPSKSQREAAAARLEAKCPCGKGRHRRECPLFREPKPSKIYACRKCQQPKVLHIFRRCPQVEATL